MAELLQWVKWCHERCPSMERVMQGFVDPQGDWTPSAEDKSLAWELYVDLVDQFPSMRSWGCRATTVRKSCLPKKRKSC